MIIIMKRSGNSLRHIPHPKMYLVQNNMATPLGQKQAYFPAQKKGASLLSARIIHAQHLTTLPQKSLYVNLTDNCLSVYEGFNN